MYKEPKFSLMAVLNIAKSREFKYATVMTDYKRGLNNGPYIVEVQKLIDEISKMPSTESYELRCKARYCYDYICDVAVNPDDIFYGSIYFYSTYKNPKIQDISRFEIRRNDFIIRNYETVKNNI